MDNARWPWGPQLQLKRTKWWAPGENPKEFIKEIFGEEGSVDSVYLDESGNFEAFEEEIEEDIEDPHQRKAKVRGEKSKPSPQIVDPTVRRPQGKVPHEHSDDGGILVHPSGYVIPTPGEAPDFVSEDFNEAFEDRPLPPPGENPKEFIKEIFGEEGSVDSVYLDESGNFEAFEEEIEEDIEDPHQRKAKVRGEKPKPTPQIVHPTVRRPQEKVPHEHSDDGGILVHPSGYVIPTPGEAPDFVSEDFDEEFEGRPLPPHIAGSVKQKKFPKAGKAPKSRQASIVPNPQTPIPSETKAIRDQYMPTLAETPFWRPLLSMTLSTRPLAVTLARLSRGLPRGLPFYASISNDDRKTHASYSARLRNMRIDRMEDLTVQIAQLLAGARGGFIGIRFSTAEKGRGINGQGLEAPLATEKRTIKVGVGNWYQRVEEVKEAFREDAINRVGEVGVGLEDIGETFEIAGLDDHGTMIDDKTGEVIPWREAKPFETAEFMEAFLDTKTEEATQIDENVDIVEVWRNENVIRRERKLKRQELARSYKYEIALQLAQKHRSVTAP
jgi:hypothetical protein